MDDDRFDAWTRFATTMGSSRRAVLRLLAGTVLGGSRGCPT